MSKLACLGSFIGGGILGAIFTYCYFNKKIEALEALHEEEVESVVEEFKKKLKADLNNSSQKEKISQDLRKPDLDKYVKKIEKERYSPLKNKPEYEGPYEISVEVFAYEDEDKNDNTYDKVTLTHYADGVLAGSDGEELDNVEDLVGNYEELETFKSGDTVYIRNEKYGIDYEITQDEGTFQEELSRRPRRVEV